VQKKFSCPLAIGKKPAILRSKLEIPFRHSAERIDLEFVNIYEPPKGGLVDFTDQRLCRVKMTFSNEVTRLPGEGASAHC
jgi:hypothetical protein